jgi:hypothetical protein
VTTETLICQHRCDDPLNSGGPRTQIMKHWPGMTGLRLFA